MKILNLEPGFAPLGVRNILTHTLVDFPSGCEPHIKITDHYPTDDQVFITCRIKTCADIIRLLLATDALKRNGIKTIDVFIPYLPFARQDRVMVPGEPLSVKVMADLINSQNYNSVIIYDCHSEVGPALINNCKALTNHEFVADVLRSKKNYFMVCPDAGAHKKLFKLCQAIGYTGKIVMCNKVRDLNNGNIIETSCDLPDFYGTDVVIVDDLIDAGGTFVLLAKELQKRNAGAITLIASHGIFSKGIDALEGIDEIHTTNSFNHGITHHKLTTHALHYAV